MDNPEEDEDTLILPAVTVKIVAIRKDRRLSVYEIVLLAMVFIPLIVSLLMAYVLTIR